MIRSITQKKSEADIDRLLEGFSRIFIIGCGTSWHAGLIAEYLFEEYAQVSVEVEYASEFRYRKPVLSSEDVVILISQSGETADTLAAMEEAQSKGALLWSIVNVFGPDAVILGGGITLAWGERLIAPAREAVSESAFRIQAERVRIVQAALGDDVGLIGTVPLVASALPELAR